MIFPLEWWERFLVGSLAAFAAAYSASSVVNQWKERRRHDQALEAFKAAKDTLREATEVVTNKHFRESLNLVVSSSPAVSPNASALIFRTEMDTLRSQLQDLNLRVKESKNEIVEVQRIDPILEATLKLTVENLVKRIDQLETKVLGKWDVALIVAQILATLGVLLGITFGIVKYLHP